MGIRIDHNPAASVVGPAAYTAGAGLYRQRQQEVARDQYNRDRQFYAVQQEAQDRRELQAASFAQDAWQQQARQAERAQVFAYQAAQQEFERQSQQQQFQAEQEANQQKLLQDGLKAGTLRYTNTQKQQMAKLYNDHDRIQQAPNLRPQDRARAMQEVQQRLKMIQPRPVLEDERPKSPREIVANSTVFANGRDTQDGHWTIDPTTGKVDKWNPPRNTGAGQQAMKPLEIKKNADTDYGNVLKQLPKGVVPTPQEQQEFRQKLLEHYGQFAQEDADPNAALTDTSQFVPESLRQRVALNQRRPEITQAYKEALKVIESRKKKAVEIIEAAREGGAVWDEKKAKWIPGELSDQELAKRYPGTFELTQWEDPGLKPADFEAMPVESMMEFIQSVRGTQQPPQAAPDMQGDEPAAQSGMPTREPQAAQQQPQVIAANVVAKNPELAMQHLRQKYPDPNMQVTDPVDLAMFAELRKQKLSQPKPAAAPKKPIPNSSWLPDLTFIPIGQ